MHSILLFGGTIKDRKQRVFDILSISAFPENHPDFKIVSIQQKKSIGIDEIRKLKEFLSTRPLKKKEKSVVIFSARYLTVAAQNALLKTLEEPPKNSKIILETQNDDDLVPTITSRCQKVNLGNKKLVDENSPEHTAQVKVFIELLGEGIGKRLDYVERNKQKIAAKEYAAGLLNIWVSVLRDKMLLNKGATANILNKQNEAGIKKLDIDTKKIIELIGMARELKENIQNTNASIRLAIEIFLLSI